VSSGILTTAVDTHEENAENSSVDFYLKISVIELAHKSGRKIVEIL
jgi:hypothetical protein